MAITRRGSSGANGSESDAHRGTDRGPLPEEALDALVTVLDEIRLGRSRSRSELVVRTGLSRAIVAQRVSELIDRGLVAEGDTGPSTGGRPPRQLAFTADAGHVLVADLGATSIDVAVTSLDGRILGHHDEPAEIADGPDACLERVDELFDQLRAPDPVAAGPLWGVGIGVPGPVEFATGTADLAADHARLGRLPGPRPLLGALRRPGLGRQRRQPPRPRGVALRDRGRPRQRGRHQDRDRDRRRDHLRGQAASRRAGNAGDVGHIQVVDDTAIVCRCGNIGCLEALAGGAALAREGLAAARGRAE